MAAKKVNSYITSDLDWAEEQLKKWRNYIDINPIDQLTDRMDYKETKNGGMMRTVVASIEQQIKSVQDTMKNYLLLLEVIDKLREKEATKAEAKGNTNIPHRMQRDAD